MEIQILGVFAAVMMMVGLQATDAAAWDRREAATIIGAVTGGVIGSRVGKGDGKIAATVVGTIIGAVIGSELDRDTTSGRTTRVHTRTPVYVNQPERRRYSKWNKRKSSHKRQKRQKRHARSSKRCHDNRHGCRFGHRYN